MFFCVLAHSEDVWWYNADIRDRRKHMNLFEFQPAGQGLFYTGSLAYGTYHFVYDCGTENRIEYLRSRIDSYVDSLKRGTEKPVIDFLVISHLHKDHFSGVYDLLQKAGVKKIYLPYLGEDRQTIKFLLAYAVFANGGETDGGAAEDAPNGEEAARLFTELETVPQAQYFLRGVRDPLRIRQQILFAEYARHKRLDGQQAEVLPRDAERELRICDRMTAFCSPPIFRGRS